MKQWLESFIKAIVVEPDEVSVTRSEGVLTVVFQLRVASGDYGRVKGRRGRMISALQSVVGLAGVRQRKRYVVELLDSEPAPAKV